MCSLCQFVWMKIGVFSLKSAEAPLWAPVVLNGLPPPPCAFALCWTDRHQSTMRAIKEQTDPYAFISLSRYFDVTQWSFCAALLQVKHTSGFFLHRELWDSCLRQILCCLWLWQNSGGTDGRTDGRLCELAYRNLRITTKNWFEFSDLNSHFTPLFAD